MKRTIATVLRRLAARLDPEPSTYSTTVYVDGIGSTTVEPGVWRSSTAGVRPRLR